MSFIIKNYLKIFLFSIYQFYLNLSFTSRGKGFLTRIISKYTGFAVYKIDNLYFELNPSSLLDRYLINNMSLNQLLLSEMDQCLNENAIFIDVGANIGYFSILAEKLFDCKVIAIEPSSRELKRFKRNISLNECNRIDVHSCACGSKEKLSFLSLSNFENPSMNYITEIKDFASIRVKEKTLDSLLLSTNHSDILLCKIDVEGYELEVLNGLSKSFAYMKNCTYVIEISPDYLKRNNASVESIYDFFYIRNYRPIVGIQNCIQWEEIFKPCT